MSDSDPPIAEDRPTAKHPTLWTYTKVFATLMALLVVTVVAAFIDFDRFLPGTGWSAAIALTVAVVKGVLIILFFMHIRYSQWVTWAFAGAAFVWLGIMFVLTMSEYLSRNEPPGTTPRGEPRYVQTPPPAAR